MITEGHDRKAAASDNKRESLQIGLEVIIAIMMS